MTHRESRPILLTNSSNSKTKSQTAATSGLVHTNNKTAPKDTLKKTVITSNETSTATHTIRIPATRTIPSTARTAAVATASLIRRTISAKAARQDITNSLTRIRAAVLTMICGSTAEHLYSMACNSGVQCF